MPRWEIYIYLFFEESDSKKYIVKLVEKEIKKNSKRNKILGIIIIV